MTSTKLLMRLFCDLRITTLTQAHQAKWNVDIASVFCSVIFSGRSLIKVTNLSIQEIKL